jgi:hypothetical protein
MADHKFAPDCGPVAYTPSQSIHPDRLEAETQLAGISGVEGVGEGRDEIGDPAWIAYVKDSSIARRLPSHISGRPVVPQISGEIHILPEKVGR